MGQQIGRISFSKAMLWFGAVMILVYIGAGIALIFFPVMLYAPEEFKTIFGIFFVVYGLFRLVRVIPKFKQHYNHENDAQ
jgi:NADH:ubiquinone oxidoreductase subunit 6 (subunit J)